MYIIKFTFEKPNADVLLEVANLLPECLEELTINSSIIHINYFRSEDRTYAELFHVWEDESTYLKWKMIALPYIEEFEALAKENSIDYQKFYPTVPNEDWSGTNKLTWENLIFFEDIFI